MNINEVLQEYDSMFGRCALSEIEAFLKQNIERANSEKDYGSMITLLNEIIGFYRDTTKRDEALLHSEKLLHVMDEINLQGRVEYATSLLNIANAYRAFGLCKESINLYEEVYANYQMNVKLGSFDYASLFNNWSLVYQEIGDFEKARELLMKALEVVDLYEEALIPQANTRTNLAVTLLQLQDEKAYSEAMKYLSQALAIYEKDGGKDFHYGAALVAMGDAHMRKKEYDTASKYYARGMEEVKHHVGETDNYSRIEEKYQYCISCLENTACNIAQPDKNDKKQWVSNSERSRRFYEEYGKEMIAKEFPEYEQRIAVGLVGEGSDCFGFDDEISADHDYEVGFCMWLTSDDYKAIGDSLQNAYENLCMCHDLLSHDAANSRFIRERRGVFAINDFYNHLLGTQLDYEAGQMPDYLTVEEQRLATVVNGTVYCDVLGVFSEIRNRQVSYYSDDAWRIRLAKQIHDFSQYAQSNYPRMMARNDVVTANMCIAKAVESVMDIAHLLNKKYAPYYKWKMKSMEQLLQMQELLPLLRNVISLPIQDAAWKNVRYDACTINEQDQVVVLFEKIARIILQELQVQGLIEGKDAFLEQYCKQLLKGKNMDLIEEIVNLEWNQFDKVKNEGGRADCQDDFVTFSVMRKSQYMTWNRDLLVSYQNDLIMANQKGWNLIMEKYARMMKSTAPERYAELEKDLPVLNEKRVAIQEEIIKIQVAWMEEFASKYPKMADNARSIHTSEDHAYNTSYETYLRGELGTYSENTFVLYGRFITELVKAGKNLAYETMCNTAKLYGYASVEDAEKRMW